MEENKQAVIEAAKLKGELDEAALELLKNQYPGLKSIIFEHDETGEKAVVYVKKVSRPVFEAAIKIEKTSSELTLAEYLLKNLRVGGMDDKEIIADLDWLKNFAAIAQRLTYVKYGEIKKN
jgi:hypothetical protein